jgi:hypothetical protein
MRQNGAVQKSSKRRPGKVQRRSRRLPAWAKWTGVATAVGLLAYGVSQMSGVPYDEVAMGGVVDFSVLTPAQKVSALQEANRARCNCGCGMTLAQCVATDRTCPVRDDHIDRIKGMVARAMR